MKLKDAIIEIDKKIRQYEIQLKKIENKDKQT